jgi:hypothetical protein
MNYYLYLIILALYISGVIVIYSRENNKKISGILVLILIISVSIVNIFYFNTDAEDTYIALRYVKNYINSGEWVFNSFDRVEGYSDFFWLILIAFVHKVTNIDIPLVARSCGLFFTILSVLYTYYLTRKISNNEFASYMAAIILAINGSFSCYALSGLENPLFSFLLISIIHVCFIGLWWLCGLLVALLFMTRPEGIVIYLPLFLFILEQQGSFKSKIITYVKLILSSMIILLPWLIWKYNFYGYLIPNSLAAKLGMDPWHQLKIGIKYTLNFLYTNQIIVLIFSFIISLSYLSINRFKLFSRHFISYRFIVYIIIIYFIFYTYSGGDWMPGYRFYSSLIPVIAIFLFIIWSQIEKKYSIIIRYNQLFIFFFISSGYLHIITNQDLFKQVRSWDHQVQGLKEIGKWFHKTLPANTVVATFPNGAFSYYNELPTLDVAGLTDNMTGRFGIKEKFGKPGHISTNWPYIINKRPYIIAEMSGNGFESIVNKRKIFGYNNVTFEFINGRNRNGSFVNLYLRSDMAEDLITFLSVKNEIRLVFNE